MIEIEGRFATQTNGCGYFGRVMMEITESENNEIDLSNIKGWENEQVYSGWIKGAEIGAKYALTKLDKKYTIRVKKILATDCDSNPIIIGTATIFGIWKGVNAEVDASEIDELTHLTLDSWKYEPDSFPDYEKKIIIGDQRAR